MRPFIRNTRPQNNFEAPAPIVQAAEEEPPIVRDTTVEHPSKFKHVGKKTVKSTKHKLPRKP